MKLNLLFLGISLAHGLSWTPALAQTDSAKAALERCESAVAETVKRMRGAAAQELQFVAARRSVLPAQEDETSVRGDGRYSSRSAGANGFTYSCAYNAKAGTTSGVMFRETGSDRAQLEPVWQPDLTFVSPGACEGASAADLTQKYPRVVRIEFDADSRRLAPASDVHTSLAGQGAMQRAPGMQSVQFNYRCEIDIRDGRIVSVQTTP